jgi:hypothetical protein
MSNSCRSLDNVRVTVEKRLSKGKFHNFISVSSTKLAIKQAQEDVQFALEEVDVRDSSWL